MSIIVNFEETPPKYEDVMNKFSKKNVKIKENNLTLENRNKWTKDIWDIKARLPKEVDICGDDEWEFDRLFLFSRVKLFSLILTFFFENLFITSSYFGGVSSKLTIIDIVIFMF